MATSTLFTTKFVECHFSNSPLALDIFFFWTACSVGFSWLSLAPPSTHFCISSQQFFLRRRKKTYTYLPFECILLNGQSPVTMEEKWEYICIPYVIYSVWLFSFFSRFLYRLSSILKAYYYLLCVCVFFVFCFSCYRIRKLMVWREEMMVEWEGGGRKWSIWNALGRLSLECEQGSSFGNFFRALRKLFSFYRCIHHFCSISK